MIFLNDILTVFYPVRCKGIKAPEGRFCEGCWQARKGWLPDRPKLPYKSRRKRDELRDKRAGGAASQRSSSDETDGSQKGASSDLQSVATCDSGFGSLEMDTTEEGGSGARPEMPAKNAMGGIVALHCQAAKNARGSGDPAAQVGEEPLKATELVNRKLEGVGGSPLRAGLATNFSSAVPDSKSSPGKSQVKITVFIQLFLYRYRSEDFV